MVNTQAGTPPEGTPPDGAPPAGAPPAGTPPAGTPPDGTPPDGKSLLGGSSPDDKGGEQKKAPEKYEPFRLPDGIKLNEKGISDFSTIAKELNLTQEDAQKLVDLQGRIVNEERESSLNEFKSVVKSWKEESLKELGADSQKKLSFASKAIDTFGTPALREFLDSSGIGNHKELVNFFIKIGENISEDVLVTGKGSTDAEKSIAETLYNTMQKR